MKLKMMVFCQGHKYGGPGVFHCIVSGDDEDYDDGKFYDLAKEMAAGHDWESPMVAIDENDAVASGFDYLFANFDEQDFGEGTVE